MKREKFVVALILLAGACVPLALAQDAPAGLGKLMKERIDISAAEGKIREEQNTALGAQSTKVGGYWQAINALQGPVKTDVEIAQMKSNLESMKNQVAAMEQAVAVAGIKDPADRAAKLKELQGARDKAQQELFAAQAPYTQRIQDAEAPLLKDGAAYGVALAPFIKDGSGLKADKPQVQGMWVNVQWKDADGKVAVSGSLNVETPPQNPFPYPNKIDGKYPIEMNTNSALGTRTGYFRVNINISKGDLTGDTAKLTALIKSLVDLDGLAAVKPE